MGLNRNCEIVNEKDFENFKKFAVSCLFSDSDKDPAAVMKDMVRIIDYVRVNFRNKAAHKDTINIVTARNCIEYCIVGEHKLGILMDYFRS